MRIIIFGSTGFVGRNLVKHLAAKHEIIASSRNADQASHSVDCLHCDQVRRILFEFKPDAIVNATGNKNVKACQTHKYDAFRTNAHLPMMLGRATPPNIKIIQISTDYVFSADQKVKTEQLKPKPDTVYGESKLAGEILLHDSHKNCVSIRTGGLYDTDHPLILSTINSLTNGFSIDAYDNVCNTPTYIDHLAKYIDYCLRQDITGVRHFADLTSVSRYEWLKKIASLLGRSKDLIRPIVAPADSLIPSDLSLLSSYHNSYATTLDDALTELLSVK